VTDAGQSHFDGCLAAAALPRDQVAALLPPELTLADRADDGDTHPLLVMFGEQLDCAMIVGGLLVPTQLRYWEFCLAIPYVVRRGERYLHAYVARMYSSWAPVVWDGNARFGYAKERADMRWDGDLFTATATMAACAGMRRWKRTASGGAPRPPVSTRSPTPSHCRSPAVASTAAGWNPTSASGLETRCCVRRARCCGSTPQ
jgi:hypothetical protein